MVGERLLPDRIEIVSHPGADRSITMDGLKNYRVFNRRYRNRRIGEFLKELHLTEGRNTGFGKILRALEKMDHQNLSLKLMTKERLLRLLYLSILILLPVAMILATIMATKI